MEDYIAKELIAATLAAGIVQARGAKTVAEMVPARMWWEMGAA